MAKRRSVHDSFFKKVFADPRAAAELLRLAISVSEGAETGAKFRSFRVVEETKRRTRLSEVRTDLLFEAKYKERPVLVYVLYEHKSTPEWDSVFQVLSYMIELWRPKIKNREPLRRIVPVIVYHGAGTWNVPRTFGAYFSEAEPLDAAGPDLRPLFVEVDALGEDALRRLSRYTHNALFTLRYYVDRKKPERYEDTLVSALSLPKRPPIPRRLSDLYQTTLDYVLEISTEKQIETILKVVEQTAGREFAMTAAESLRKEGRKKGLQEGRQQGQREALVRLMTKKFGMSDAERKLVETVGDMDRLAAALDEIIVAKTKEEVLARLR